jgi:NAD(P)-dependent dehydrogenase (short-subunit alcohol dehydrogenase family)
MKTLIITGSEGIVGSELCKYFQQNNKVIRLDLQLGHDLTNEKFVKRWFKTNHADHLINCFAMNDHVCKSKRRRYTVFDFPLSSFSKYLDVNLTSLFSVCREFARNNDYGTIVNFSSTYGLLSPHPTMYDGSHKDVAYGVSKAGVINLTRYLAVHLSPNIRVNCVVPGGILHDQEKKFIKKYSNLTPLKRMMNVKELNSIIDYLSSDKSSYVTGSTFVVDGGYTIW